MTTADTRRLRLLSANIQAGSSTRRYSDYVTRSWSHALPAGNKRGSLDAIALQAAADRVFVATDARMGEVYCAAFETARGARPRAVSTRSTQR